MQVARGQSGWLVGTFNAATGAMVHHPALYTLSRRQEWQRWMARSLIARLDDPEHRLDISGVGRVALAIEGAHLQLYTLC